MTYIAFSILCSVLVSVLFKLAPGRRIDVRQVIAGSYLVAVLLCLGLFRSSLAFLWQPFSNVAWGLLLILGVLMPSLFLVLARSVIAVGVVRTDAAQRLSLLLPLLAAFTLFGETLTWLKALGLALGLFAIACIVSRASAASTAGRGGWHWPLVVFIGMGIVDILFKRMAQLSSVPFTDVLLAAFTLALALALLYIASLYVRGQANWSWRNAVAALLLGTLNFGNIFFYVRAHQQLAAQPALVFSAMNIGVIVLATLVGALLFGEQLGRLNRAGLLLAVVAVALLAIA